MERGQIQARLKPHAVALIPGGIVVALMLVWAVHDGGFDEDTWYWGALVVLALFTAIVIARGVAADAHLAGGHDRARRVRAVRGVVVSVDHVGRSRPATR